MSKSTRSKIVWVGLDAHKRSISVTVLVGAGRDPLEWEIPNTQASIKRLAKKLREVAEKGEVRCCYEAGPLGFTLQRDLEKSRHGIVCEVVAPSLIPSRPGDRVKTDRRDARKLAIQNRAGALTVVRPPEPEEEAARDLCRCREDAVHDQNRARQRLQKFLLRQGYRWMDGSSWTQKHHRWLRSLQFEHRAGQLTFEDYLETVLVAEERVRGLDQAISDLAETEAYRKCVGWLRCFRGIDTVSAMTILTELHGFERFRSPRELMGYLGLTPSESSSGDRVRRGGITKTGNRHVRRILVEASWSQRHRPVVSRFLKKRREGQPAWVVSIADRALRRLNRRYKALSWKKHHNVALAAVARELAGFIWAVLSRQETGASGKDAA